MIAKSLLALQALGYANSFPYLSEHPYIYDKGEVVGVLLPE